MIKKILFVLLIAASVQNAQITGTLRGQVTDSLSGEALSYANVFIKEFEVGAATDVRGFFQITNLPISQIFTVKVTYVGYETKEFGAFIRAGKIASLSIKLNPLAYNLQTIEKVENRVPDTRNYNISFESLSPSRLERVPQNVEADIFRSLKTLGGVSSTSDVSARFNVRGGSSNQNLVLLDGATIYQPFHAMGLFSAVDPEIINSVEFYKGGFPAEYGGRLSSVVNITTKDGNLNKFSGKAAAGLLTGKALVEGPIPYGSFIISGRKNLDNRILRSFLNSDEIPVNFHDISFKANYRNPDLLMGRQFSAHGFFSSDKINYNDVYREDISWKNSALGISWYQLLEESPLFYRFAINSVNYEGEVNPNLSGKRYKRNFLRELSLDTEFSYIFPYQDEVGAGIQIKEIENSLQIENRKGLVTSSTQHGASIVFFVKYALNRIKDFGLEAGTRFNVTRLAVGTAGEYYFEPRVLTFYNIGNFARIKGSWGLHFQEMTTLSDENEVISVFEPWVVVPEYLNPAYAIHYIAGIDLFLTPGLSIGAEAYYKPMLYWPSVNEKKYFEQDPDLINGQGNSRGFELSVNYLERTFSLSANYSLSWTIKSIDNLRYYPRYDSRHNLNLMTSVKLPFDIKFDALWTFNSGLPYTQLVGYYNKLIIDDLRERIFSFIPYTILSERNATRLPAYHRLDISFSRRFDLRYLNLTMDMSIINLYDRANIFYFERDSGKKINMLPFLPTLSMKVEI